MPQYLFEANFTFRASGTSIPNVSMFDFCDRFLVPKVTMATLSVAMIRPLNKDDNDAVEVVFSARV